MACKMLIIFWAFRSNIGFGYPLSIFSFQSKVMLIYSITQLHVVIFSSNWSCWLFTHFFDPHAPSPQICIKNRSRPFVVIWSTHRSSQGNFHLHQWHVQICSQQIHALQNHSQQFPVKEIDFCFANISKGRLRSSYTNVICNLVTQMHWLSHPQCVHEKENRPHDGSWFHRKFCQQ